jgi:hypothetical protein
LCIPSFDEGRSFNTDLFDVPTVNQRRHSSHMGQILEVEEWIDAQIDFGLQP